MSFSCLTPDQEDAFIQKLAKQTDNLAYYPEILICDHTLSRRHINGVSNIIISIVNSVEDGEIHYIPIRFNFKKSGDEKHRVVLLITSQSIEVFDSNSWEWILNCPKYRNKQNLLAILNKVQQETNSNIFTYNYSLNCVSGSCASFALLFMLYRVNGLSIDDVCHVFEFYESRINVHYEKKMDKLIKQKEFDWSIYHDIITGLINQEI